MSPGIPSQAGAAGRGRRTVDLEADLGRQLRDLRHRADLTQDDLARRANVGVSTVRRLEAGQGGTLDSLIAVVRALDREDWLATLAPAPVVSPMEALRARRAAEAKRRQRVRPRRPGAP
jgi:transcriptional regulator with XRE-family HTH domain